jgi:DNA polymerase-3 subunit epsilon
MFVTALDLETSGLDPNTDRITEVGAVLWNVETRKPVTFLSELIYDQDPNCPPLKPEITELTGIDDKMLETFGVPLGQALGRLGLLLRHSVAVIVHGGIALDKAMIEQKYTALVGELPQIPWVDTQVDFAYPEQMKMRALKYLAADHRYTLDFAHRGLFDSMATIYIASHYDIKAAIELARHPMIKVHAGVDFNTKDEAKTRGYYYDNNTRSWFKNIRACLLEHERSKCPFTVTEVVAPPTV